MGRGSHIVRKEMPIIVAQIAKLGMITYQFGR